ncbi:MAG: bifunctional allantoicase/(S)-ureidoglycine aminohydrolase [Ahrensia sp.]|nr:bifunctional allantoicase/(S)-ureidoglycine aminohydrolase [Ahrensia sp.]
MPDDHTKRTYYAPTGGLPSQTERMDPRAVLTTAYAFIPAQTQADITTSALPHWEKTRLWVLARPMSGFAETFSHYLMEVAPGGGSTQPEPSPHAEAVLFATEGRWTLQIDGNEHAMKQGAYAYLPGGIDWTVANDSNEPAHFHWFRKSYETVEGIEKPEAFVVNETDIDPIPMPDTQGRWATTRFVDPTDVRHDMHVNIVTFQPGGLIPFPETHVMEHGIYVLEGKASYKLNQDWIEVEAGDYMWLRAFCPQACYAAGPGPFRYLLYKDVNRHAALGPIVR